MRYAQLLVFESLVEMIDISLKLFLILLNNNFPLEFLLHLYHSPCSDSNCLLDLLSDCLLLLYRLNLLSFIFLARVEVLSLLDFLSLPNSSLKLNALLYPRVVLLQLWLHKNPSYFAGFKVFAREFPYHSFIKDQTVI
jgi:hypothetical protein